MQGAFTKHGRRGRSHRRHVRVDAAHGFLSWAASPSATKTKRVALGSVLGVSAGKDTPVFARRPCRHVDAARCFSLILGARTVDLEAATTEERDRWVSTLRALVRQFQSSQATARGGSGNGNGGTRAGSGSGAEAGQEWDGEGSAGRAASGGGRGGGVLSSRFWFGESSRRSVGVSPASDAGYLPFAEDEAEAEADLRCSWPSRRVLLVCVGVCVAFVGNGGGWPFPFPFSFSFSAASAFAAVPSWVGMGGGGGRVGGGEGRASSGAVEAITVAGWGVAGLVAVLALLLFKGGGGGGGGGRSRFACCSERKGDGSFGGVAGEDGIDIDGRVGAAAALGSARGYDDGVPLASVVTPCQMVHTTSSSSNSTSMAMMAGMVAGTVVEEEVFENQRYMPLRGWSPKVCYYIFQSIFQSIFSVKVSLN